MSHGRSQPENAIRTDAFGLAIVFALGVSGLILATQGRTCARAPIILDEFINPNTAPVASLLRLSGIGPIRAQAIVAYRQALAVERPGQKPFGRINDMTRIKGLGPRTVSVLGPWLMFDD